VSEERRRVSSDVWQPAPDDEARRLMVETLDELAGDPFLQNVAARSLELLHLGAGMRVLDVGCGPGALLPALAQLVGPDGRVVGLDYAAPLLETARERVDAAGIGDRVELVLDDAHHLPFPDASFDAVHVERVLMHLEDPDAAIREMRRVTRPGGWVVAAEPDSGGVRTDHPTDPEGMQLISDRDLRQFRNGAIGLELYRRFSRAGLVDRLAEPMATFMTSYEDVGADGDRIAAAELVAEGVMSRERADAVLTTLHEADARGEFSWIGIMVVAAGRVPAPNGGNPKAT
jgi:SAM-dependent methyltransferase